MLKYYNKKIDMEESPRQESIMETRIREQHLKNVNKIFFGIVVILTLFLTMGLVSQLQMSQRNPIISIIPLCLLWICFIGEIILFIKTKGSKWPLYYIAVMFSITYAVILLGIPENTTYPYIFPVLIIMVIAMEEKLVYLQSILMVVINITKIIMTVIDALNNNIERDVWLEQVMIEFVLIVLVTIAAILGVRTLIKYMKETSYYLSVSAEEQINMSKNVVEKANNARDFIDDIVESVDVIKEQTDFVAHSLKEIASGTVVIAETSEEQNLMSSGIQKTIDESNKKMSDIVGVMEQTLI